MEENYANAWDFLSWMRLRYRTDLDQAGWYVALVQELQEVPARESPTWGGHLVDCDAGGFSLHRRTPTDTVTTLRLRALSDDVIVVSAMGVTVLVAKHWWRIGFYARANGVWRPSRYDDPQVTGALDGFAAFYVLARSAP